MNNASPRTENEIAIATPQEHAPLKVCKEAQENKLRQITYNCQLPQIHSIDYSIKQTQKN